MTRRLTSLRSRNDDGTWRRNLFGDLIFIEDRKPLVLDITELTALLARSVPVAMADVLIFHQYVFNRLELYMTIDSGILMRAT